MLKLYKINICVKKFNNVKNVNFLAYSKNFYYLCIRKIKGKGKTLEYSLRYTLTEIVKEC